MAEQAKSITKKPRGRPATGKGKTIGVRVHPKMMRVLDAYRLEQDPPLTRPEAMRLAFKEWATFMGLAKPQELD
jgi:hypothetical protein